MQRAPRGAHLLIQTRTKVLSNFRVDVVDRRFAATAMSGKVVPPNE